MLPFPIVDNMTDVAEQQQLFAQRGFNISADDIIQQSLQQVAQDLVNEKTTGEYDRVVLTGDLLTIYDINGTILTTIPPRQQHWLTDFQEDADAVWEHLIAELNRFFSR